MVSLTLSRVVPGIGVTIASSAPANALSSELLPTFGCPASTTVMPSRSNAPWRARASTASTASGDRSQAAARVGLLEEVDLLLGEVERGLDQHAQLDQLVAQRVDLLRERAGERAARRARGRFGAGLDQVADRFGLRQVELAVEKGPLGELARLRQSKPVQPRPTGAGAISAAASRQRATSSCSTTGPPWACSSSTSSPV